jgi:hypothetical protein
LPSRCAINFLLNPLYPSNGSTLICETQLTELREPI